MEMAAAPPNPLTAKFSKNNCAIENSYINCQAKVKGYWLTGFDLVYEQLRLMVGLFFWELFFTHLNRMP
jgi:hypothetical protein